MERIRVLSQVKPLLVILSIVCLLVSAGAAFHWLGTDGVEVIRPHRGLAVQAVYATGTVESPVMLPIAPRVAARLKELYVDEGASVRKNQLLARMEDEVVLQTIRELQANEAFLEHEFKRKESLLKQRVISKAELDRARTELAVAEAAVAKAVAESDFMKLLAPADGRIIRRDGEVGELIPAYQAVFWISCCTSLRISAEVDEEDIALVQPGQRVLIRADAFPQQIYEGSVQSITPKGDPVSRSYRVRIGFSEETSLMIGMTAETNIIIRETPEALLLPSGAVTQGNVWLVEENMLVKRKVTIGAKGLKETEILSGIEDDDVIVLKPRAGLEEGLKIRPRMVRQEE